MNDWEMERQWNAKIFKLYEEGALDARLSIKTEWTNETMRKIAEILTTAKIEHFMISKAILHPTKDVGPQKHEKHIVVFVACSPFKIDELVEQLGKIGEASIDRLCSGFALLKTWERGDSTWILKEEEPSSS